MKVFANSTEVPFQALADGNFLVRAAGGIAANSTTRWSVLPSRAAGVFSSQVWVTDTGTLWEIDNGIIAIRVPKTIPCPTPATLVDPPTSELRQRFTAPSSILAPIQGIRHRDGTWTGDNPNYLYVFYGYNAAFVGGSWNWPATVPGVIEIVENGPLRVKVRLTYSGLRPTSWVNLGGGRSAYVLGLESGGYYICTITLEAGQNTFNIQNECNGEINWHVDMSTGAPADRARYKGHTCNDILKGHNYDGTIYNTQYNSVREGEVNLSEAGTRDTTDWAGVPFDCVKYPDLYHWYDYIVNAGVYWYVYNSAGGSSSNAWGIIQGLPSYETALNRNGVYGTPAAGTPTTTGFFTTGVVRLIDERVGHDCKYDFNIMLGTKSTDVPVDFSAMVHSSTLSNSGYQAVYPSGFVKSFNYCSGPAQAWKQADQGVEFPDPVGGWPGMHLTRAETEALILAISSASGPGSYYEYIRASDTQYTDVWDAFHDGTNALASDLVDDYCIPYLNYVIDLYVNNSSYTQQVWFYFNGAQAFQRIVIRAMAMISLDQSPGRSFLTTLQKRQLKAALAMVGHITWDGNFVPVYNSEHSQFNFGTANSPVQFGEMQSQFTAVLRTHPQFTERFDTVLERSINTFNTNIVASGAVKNCPKYAGTYVTPTTDVFRQLQVSNYYDLFASGSPVYDRLVKMCEWLIQLITPPQYRFGNRRKMISYGDGSSEASNLVVGPMMGFVVSNPTLYKRMAWVWVEYGRSLFSFYSCTGLKVTPTVLTQDPALTDYDFEGSFTVFRNSWGVADEESAVFLHHGYANVDHCTFQRGSPAIYLLGAPISISFGAVASPKVNGPWVGASTYMAVSELDTTDEYPAYVWNTYPEQTAYYPTELKCGSHYTYFDDTYTHSFTSPRCDVTCTFDVDDHWVRTMTYYRDDVLMPVVRLRDSNDGIGDSVYTLHVMATGSYKRPDGSTVAEPTTLTGTTFAITNGQRFEFTGQWGVHFDVYYFGPTAEAMVGRFKHNYHPNTEQAQYMTATGAPAFEEKQYIIRIKTAGPCDTVIVPYRTRPAGLNVTSLGGGNLNLFTTAGGNRPLPN